jgi:hypothetical protein
MNNEKAIKTGTVIGSIFGTLIVIGMFIGIGYLAFILIKGAIAPRPWKGIFFPDANNTSYSSVTKDFKTLEECRAWANKEAEDSSLSAGVWSYECGKNCKFNNKESLGNIIDTYDCEEISK